MILAFGAIVWSNSAFAEIPNGYYDDCENKTGGKTLLQALFKTISSHDNVGYDGLWNVYKTSDVDENGKIWDMYSTKRWTFGDKQCGNYKVVGDCYNREHSMPKSWFKEASPMKSDAFHVYPTDGKVNGQRSNYPYGECANGTTLPSNGNVQALGKLGTSTFPGYSGKVFEPVDEYKGDFARTYFYMATCYNDKISGWNSDMLANNNYPCYTEWAVNLLLKWHRQDPVSEKEIKRNDAVYAYQGNRNPFIDHPELVEYIWGEKTSERWTSTADPINPDPIDPDPIDPDPDDPTPTPTPSEDGDGTFEHPYSCAQVIDMNTSVSSAWVYGYIVGAINSNKIERTTSVTTNFAISDNLNETDVKNVLGVQIRSKSEFYEELNLKQNHDNVGKKIIINGSLTEYFGRPGIKDIKEYRWIESQGDISNIIDVNSQMIQIRVANGSVEVIPDGKGVSLTIAGVDGMIWFNGSVADVQQFDLPLGIYIFRTPGNIYRILVK